MTTLTFQNVKHILAASLLSLGLVACDKGSQSTEKTADTTQTTSSIEQIKKNGVVRIGVFSDKPPFGYLDAQGKNQGFAVSEKLSDSTTLTKVAISFNRTRL